MLFSSDYDSTSAVIIKSDTTAPYTFHCLYKTIKKAAPKIGAALKSTAKSY